MRDEHSVLGVIPAPSGRSKADLRYSTELSRWFLAPIGIWPPKSDAHIIEKIISELLVFLSCFLICFQLVPCLLHVFIKEQNPKRKMKMIGPLSFSFISISKYLFMIVRKQQIYYCLEHIDVDWRRVAHLDDREIMLMKAKLVIPFAARSAVTPDNITLRPLVYTIYDPLFSAQTTPSYEIVFTIQCVSGFVVCSVTTGACSLAAVFVLHICGQLTIVRSRLDTFVRGRKDENKNVERRMAEIIELHLRALRFAIRIEGILTEVCFIELVGCTMNICFLGYYFMTEFDQNLASGPITYCILLVSFAFNIFIFCYIGETLTQQEDKVGRAAYMIDWYELPPKTARDLILLLAMTKNSINITAGKMAELSLQTFGGVLRTAAGYLNLLRTLMM
ncbi:odorant receptor 45b-like isoform X1 [Diachasmimorpha longicaudata]|uniref:odorant receptor 45b-like isoform X1 n=1 Tax=Diachasmimorpha longicaudata TaxID=58733 RepID=UPI0030B88200